MLKEAFIDTGFFIANLVAKDGAHALAREVAQKFADHHFVTCDEVLAEVLNYFSESKPYVRKRAVRAIRSVIDGDEYEVVEQDRGTFELGLTLYDTRPDKGYSLVDCVQMQHMRSRGIRIALTTDKHFRQEGFETPLLNAIEAEKV